MLKTEIDNYFVPLQTKSDIDGKERRQGAHSDDEAIL